MKSEISYLGPRTTYAPHQAFADALGKAEMGAIKDVLIIGYDDEDDLFVRSSRLSRSDALWLLELAKLHVMGRLEE